MGVASCPAPVVPQLADASSPHQAAAVLSDPISLNQVVYTPSVGPLLQHIRNIQHIQKLEYWNHIEKCWCCQGHFFSGNQIYITWAATHKQKIEERPCSGRVCLS